MENSLKGLMLAAGIIITCIIISLGFYIAREARDTASEGTGQINQLQAEFTDASKTMYDGTEVSGSEVLNVIRKFSDETMGILVQTNKNKTYYNYNFDVDKGELGKALDNSYKNAQDVASDKYINPTARFQGSIVKDVNGTIIGIVFAQVEYAVYPESTKRQEVSNGRRIAGGVDGSCACDVSDRNGVSLAGGGQQ